VLFSSPPFFIFFAAYLLLHLFVPLRWRLALVIAGSAFFYAYWNPYYAWIPFAYIAIAYFGALWMMRGAEGRPRKLRLALVIVLLLVPLAVVKYAGFVYNDVLSPILAHTSRWDTPWALPLGISFVTFTLIAYVVDVHAGRYRLERNAAMLSGLVLFFPHLIAGPILRPAELLPQLRHPKPGLGPQAGLGLAIFTLGLVKKLVFADSMAEVVERAFAPADAGLTAADYVLGIYAFALQIYCDFSGYTDMAIGAALALGVKLPSNFERPYTATSSIEFWRRWHITLSRWLRDYLYIPLGGNRKGFARQIVNLLVTMTLGGLWHGANWTFMLWGAAHGLGIAFVHGVRRAATLRWMTRMPRWLAVLITFHFVAALWILFRAPDLATAARVAAGPFVAPAADLAAFAAANGFVLGLLAFFAITHGWDSHEALARVVKGVHKAVLVPALVFAWLMAIVVSHGSSAKFIYFDF
jgi:alginate O-acetyltransferase complex protein AlgI